MKKIFNVFIYIMCLTLPAIGNAQSVLCSEGSVTKLREDTNWAGMPRTFITMYPTEGKTSLTLHGTVTGFSTISMALRTSLISGLPVRLYAKDAAGCGSLGSINAARICSFNTLCN